MVKRHVMSVLVERSTLSFSRVLGLLARKGYSIESFTIRDTDDPEASCITFAVTCEGWTLGQLRNQLEKLADVIETESGQGSCLYDEVALVTAK